MSYWQSVLAQMGWPAGADDRPLQSIALTSCGHGHGVSTVALNVAVAASVTADVLLIDANFHRPSLANLLQVPASPGLIEALAGSSPPIRSVNRSQSGRLSVLPVGTDTDFSQCHHERLTPLLRTLASDYDLLIWDFPPVTPDADFLSWLLPMDRVFLVMQHGEIDARAAQSGTTTLRRMGVDISGVIVNQSRERSMGF